MLQLPRSTPPLPPFPVATPSGVPVVRLASLAEITVVFTDQPLPQDWQGWTARRLATAALQLIARADGIDPGSIDGWWGPQTDYAANALLYLPAAAAPVWAAAVAHAAAT